MFESVLVVLVLLSVGLFVTVVGEADASVAVRSLRTTHLSGPSHPRLIDIVR